MIILIFDNLLQLSHEQARSSAIALKESHGCWFAQWKGYQEANSVQNSIGSWSSEYFGSKYQLQIIE